MPVQPHCSPTPYAPPRPLSLLGKSILGVGKGLVSSRAAWGAQGCPRPLPAATRDHRGRSGPDVPSSRPPCGLWVCTGAAGGGGHCLPCPFPEEGFPPGRWPGILRGLLATIGLGCVARRFGQGKARGQRPGLSRSFQRHGVPAHPHSGKFHRCLPSWSFRVAHLQTTGPHGAPRPYSQSPDRNGPRSGWHFEEEGRDNSASTSPSGHTPGVCVCGGGRCRLCCAGKGRRLSWPRRAVCFLLNDSLPLTWINRSRHELEGAVLINTSKSRLWGAAEGAGGTGRHTRPVQWALRDSAD